MSIRLLTAVQVPHTWWSGSPLRRRSLAVKGRCCPTVILAGGEGLRPLTRRLAGDERPKQFCAILGAETLLEQTRRRVALAISPERTTIVVTQAHQRFYAPLLADLPPARLVEQARNAGTVPAVLRTAVIAPAAPVAVFPSDHHVSDDPLFMAHVESAFQAVTTRPDLLVLLGITPDAAATDYRRCPHSQ